MCNAACIPIYSIDILYSYRLQNSYWICGAQAQSQESKHEGRMSVLLWTQSCSASPLLAAAAQHRLTPCENPPLTVLVAGELPQELLLRAEVMSTGKCTGAGDTVGCLIFATLSSGLGHRQGCSISFPSPCGTTRLWRCTRGWCWNQIWARGILTAGQVSCRAGMGKWPYFCQISQSCDTLHASSGLLCQIDANWGMTDNSWYDTKYK